MVNLKAIFLLVIIAHVHTGWAQVSEPFFNGVELDAVTLSEKGQEAEQNHRLFIDELIKLPSLQQDSDDVVLPEHLGPILVPLDVVTQKPVMIGQTSVMAEQMPMDALPPQARIAILIDDLGYNRQGMMASLDLPIDVALAILPSTPYAQKTALGAQQQERITLLHAPMENLRNLKLGPGGLYANMSEEELKATLIKDLEGLPGIQGVNNHMGSLLTAKADSMAWVMETLKGRSLFFIDSLTNPKSVAKKTAQEYGLDTVSRDVFLDNIRTEKAIDRQFSRLIMLARRHGSALAIGHPYPETTAYLKKRLPQLHQDGVTLVPLSAVLIPSNQGVMHQ